MCLRGDFYLLPSTKPSRIPFSAVGSAFSVDNDGCWLLQFAGRRTRTDTVWHIVSFQRRLPTRPLRNPFSGLRREHKFLQQLNCSGKDVQLHASWDYRRSLLERMWNLRSNGKCNLWGFGNSSSVASMLTTVVCVFSCSSKYCKISKFFFNVTAFFF